MDEVQFPWWATRSNAMAIASAMRVSLKKISDDEFSSGSVLCTTGHSSSSHSRPPNSTSSTSKMMNMGRGCAAEEGGGKWKERSSPSSSSPLHLSSPCSYPSPPITIGGGGGSSYPPPFAPNFSYSFSSTFMDPYLAGHTMEHHHPPQPQHPGSPYYSSSSSSMIMTSIPPRKDSVDAAHPTTATNNRGSPLTATANPSPWIPPASHSPPHFSHELSGSDRGRDAGEEDSYGKTLLRTSAIQLLWRLAQKNLNFSPPPHQQHPHYPSSLLPTTTAAAVSLHHTSFSPSLPFSLASSSSPIPPPLSTFGSPPPRTAAGAVLPLQSSSTTTTSAAAAVFSGSSRRRSNGSGSYAHGYSSRDGSERPRRRQGSPSSPRPPFSFSHQPPQHPPPPQKQQQHPHYYPFATAPNSPGVSSLPSYSFFSPPSPRVSLYLTLQQCTSILALMAIALECRRQVLSHGGFARGGGGGCPPPRGRRRFSNSSRRSTTDSEDSGNGKESGGGGVARGVSGGRRSSGFPPRSAMRSPPTRSFSLSPLLSPTSFASFLQVCSTFFTSLLPHLPSARFAEAVNAEEFCTSLIACGLLMRCHEAENDDDDDDDDDDDEHSNSNEEDEEERGRRRAVPEGETGRLRQDTSHQQQHGRRHSPHHPNAEEEITLQKHHDYKEGGGNGTDTGIRRGRNKENEPPHPSGRSQKRVLSRTLQSKAKSQEEETEKKESPPRGGGGGGSFSPPPTSAPNFFFSSSSSSFVSKAVSAPPPPAQMPAATPMRVTHSMNYVDTLCMTFSSRVVDTAIISCLPLTIDEVVNNPVAKGTLRGLSLSQHSIFWHSSLVKRIRALTADGIRKSVLDKESFFFSSGGGLSFPTTPCFSSSSSTFSLHSSSASSSSFSQRREILLLLLEAMSKARNTNVLRYTTPWMTKILQEESYIISGLCTSSQVHSRVVGAALTLLRRHYQHLTARMIDQYSNNTSSATLPPSRHSSSSFTGVGEDLPQKGDNRNRRGGTSLEHTPRSPHSGSPSHLYHHWSNVYSSSTFCLSSPSSSEFLPPALDLKRANTLLDGVWRTLQYAELHLPSRRLPGMMGMGGGGSSVLYGPNLQLVIFHLLNVEVERLRSSIALCRAAAIPSALGGSGMMEGPRHSGSEHLEERHPSSFASFSPAHPRTPLAHRSSSPFPYHTSPTASYPWLSQLPHEVSPQEEALRIGVISQIVKFIILPTSIFAAVPNETQEHRPGEEGEEKHVCEERGRERTIGGNASSPPPTSLPPFSKSRSGPETGDVVWDRLCEMLTRVIAMFTAPVDITLPYPSASPSTSPSSAANKVGRRKGEGGGKEKRKRGDGGGRGSTRINNTSGFIWHRKFTNQYYRNLEGMAHLLFDQIIRDGGGIPDGTDVGFAFLFAEGREVEEQQKNFTDPTAVKTGGGGGGDDASTTSPVILKSAAVQCLMGLTESDAHIRSFILSMFFDFVAKACTQCELYVLHPEESITIQAAQLLFHTLCSILVPRGYSESIQRGIRITTCGTVENVERYAKLVITSYTSILRAELQKPGANLQTMVQEKYFPTAGMIATSNLFLMLTQRVLHRMIDLVQYGKTISNSSTHWSDVSRETLDMAKILLIHMQTCVLSVAWPDSGVLYHPSAALEACFNASSSSTSSASALSPGKVLAAAAIQSLSPLLLSLSVLLHLVPPTQSSFEHNKNNLTTSSATGATSGGPDDGSDEGITVDELAYRTTKCAYLMAKEGKDVGSFMRYLSDQMHFHTTTNCCTPLFRSVWLLFTMYGLAEDAVTLMRPRFLSYTIGPVFQTGLALSNVAKVVACATSAPPLLLMNSASMQQVVPDIDILLRQLAKNELDVKHYRAYHVTLLPFSSSFSSSSIQGRLAEVKVRKQLIKTFLRVCPKSGKSLAQLRTRELFLLKAVFQLELTRVGAGYFSTIPLYQHFNVREFIASPAIPKVLQQITEYLSVQLTAVINYCFTADYSMMRLGIGVRRLLLYATFGVRSVRVSSITFIRHALHSSPMQMIQSGGLSILWQLIDLVEEADPVEMQEFCRRMKYVGDPSLPTERHSAERMEELLALQELAKEWVEVGRCRAPQDLIHLATQFITSGFSDGVSVERVHLGTRLAILAGQITAEGPMEIAQKNGKASERGTSSLVMKFSRAYGGVLGALSFLTPTQLEEKVILRLAALLQEGRQLLHPTWKGVVKGIPSKAITTTTTARGGGGAPFTAKVKPRILFIEDQQTPMFFSSSSGSTSFPSPLTCRKPGTYLPGSFFSRFESELYVASFMLRTQPIRFKTHRLLVLYVSQAPIKLFSAKAIRIASECWSWLIVREQCTLVIPILKGIVEAVQWTIGEKLGLFDGDQTRQADVVQTGEGGSICHRDSDGGEADNCHNDPETPHHAIFKFIVDNYLRHDSALTQSSHVLTLLYVLASSILRDPDALSLKDDSFLETMQAMVLVGKVVHEVFSANIRCLRGNLPSIIPFTSLGKLRQKWWKALLHWFRKFPASWYFGSDPSFITSTAISTLESLLLLLRTEKETLRQNTIGFLDFSTNVFTPGKTIGMIPSMHRRELLPKGKVTSKEKMASLVELEQQRMTQCLELLSLLVDHELLRLRVWERPRRTLELTNTMDHYAKTVLFCLDAAVTHDPMVAVAMVKRLSPVFKKLPSRLAQHVIARPEHFAHIPEAADYYLTTSVVARGAPKLFLFENASIIQALRLLDARYSHCESITSYAIRSLGAKNSNHLIFYLPQLLQVLGSDNSGRIAEFLSQMSTGNTMFCHQLLWALRTEGEGGERDGKSSASRLTNRCRALTATILQRLSPEQLDFYEHVFGYMDMVISLSGDLMEFEKLQRKPQLRQWLKSEKYHIPPKKYHLYLPTNPTFRITGVIPHTASAMQSAAKCPIFIQFEGVERELEDMRTPKAIGPHSLSSSSSSPGGMKRKAGDGAGVPVKKACIFKMGDDCRQDQLALQLIELFKRIFSTVDVPFFLYPYRVVTTGQTSGIIECVPQSLSRNEIGKLVESNLAEYFVQCFGHPETSRFRRARENFVKSVAAYSIVTFVLNIKDRHNGNIMIDANGNLIHIDFGFLFDTSPGGDLNFESSPFKLTTEMIQLIGRDVGSRSTLKSDALKKALIDEENYIYFKVLANRCFLAVRQYAHEICVLVELMLRSGLPCFKPQQTIANLAERLCMDESEITAAHYMRKRIHTARENIRTKLYDHFQRLVEGIEM